MYLNNNNQIKLQIPMGIMTIILVLPIFNKKQNQKILLKWQSKNNNNHKLIIILQQIITQIPKHNHQLSNKHKRI